MEKNEAIIPLYLNNNMINNLHTIVIHKFTELKSLTNRSQQVVKISTPLSNVTCGNYVQGTFSVELLNELSRQRAEISKQIVILLELKELLVKNNLLKQINDSSSINSIYENEFVEFTCKLKKNEAVDQVENIINAMEIELVLNEVTYSNDTKDEIEHKKEALKNLKEKVNEYKTSRCFDFIGNEVCNTSSKFVIPVELNLLQDNMDYLLSSKVTVLGKVTKVQKEKSYKNEVLTRGFLNYIDENYISSLKKYFFKDAPCLIKNYSREEKNEELPVVEILPIAIYI